MKTTKRPANELTEQIELSPLATDGDELWLNRELRREQAAAILREREEAHQAQLRKQHHPIIASPVKVPEATDPWEGRQLEVAEAEALDPRDRPPAGWHLLKPETRRRLVGLAIELLKIAPSGPERRAWLWRHANVTLNALAGGAIFRSLDAQAQGWLEKFSPADPAERGTWKDVQADVRDHYGPNAATSLIVQLAEKLDRGEPGAIEVIKGRIAAGIKALRDRIRASEDAAVVAPQAKERLAARRAQESGR